MRRGPRLPMEELAPYLLELNLPSKVAGILRVPSALNINPGHGTRSVPATDLLAWPQIFANANPVEIEVGFGKGLFLLNSGQARPQTNFLGIEIERKYTLFTATRLAKRELRNVKVACFDARLFLETLVAPESVAAIHVYFPDPWWKNRHRKRRLFTETFALQCARVLTNGGLLHLVSDVEDYFEESLRMLTKIVELSSMPVPDEQDPQHEMDFLTNFERKYRREGRPIHRASWRKLK
jgi:tRNA (guanine-N7-)-methyltransferase